MLAPYLLRSRTSGLDHRLRLVFLRSSRTKGFRFYTSLYFSLTSRRPRAQMGKVLLWICCSSSSSCLPSSSLFQDAGIWFVFHSSSTGASRGLVPETKAELTPLGVFYNNRAHSNFKVFIFHYFVTCQGSLCSP